MISLSGSLILPNRVRFFASATDKKPFQLSLLLTALLILTTITFCISTFAETFCSKADFQPVPSRQPRHRCEILTWVPSAERPCVRDYPYHLKSERRQIMRPPTSVPPDGHHHQSTSGRHSWWLPDARQRDGTLPPRKDMRNPPQPRRPCNAPRGLQACLAAPCWWTSADVF